ncbi:guanine nucleotide-binding protein g(o) subunit alpha [Anaeramoeba flamelloides]|uniref:Guanine nucleotide-binding protein g(O) subunit alpha n=1 Tax=Anaeramoeba flamelloides TaxID=1746091 RepID=A0AAV7ZTX0_9EUKA|nr:guanine nucleotide-binding protein g(o) subunit alpha [Anaeramoeba flamelloides]
MCGCINTTTNIEKEKSQKIDREAYYLHNEQNKIIRLLIVGAGESGKSTFVKQCKNLYTKGWSKKEFSRMKYTVYTNVIEAIQTLIYIKNDLELEYSNSDNKELEEEIGSLPLTIKITPDLATKIDSIWKDPSIQTAYNKRCKYTLIDSCQYFLNQVLTVGYENYKPTVDDILNLRVMTTGICETYFKYSNQKYCLIDVGGQRNERKKWIHCFEDVTSIVYVSAMSGYDQVLAEDSQTNRMTESLMLFSDICNSRWFMNNSLILFMNKMDLFDEKIKTKPLSDLFPDYDGGSDVEEAKEFIKNQFLSLNRNSKKEIYPHFTTAIDPSNIKNIFKAVNDTLLQKTMDGIGFL